MRSFEYVTIEGQLTRVPVVVCAGGAVVVREPVIVREPLSFFERAAFHKSAYAYESAAEHNSAACEFALARETDNALSLARARDVALREIHANSSTKFIDLVTRLSSRLLSAAFRSRDRNVAWRENRATADAELRSYSRSFAPSLAPFEEHAATGINTSADLAHSQRIYANGS